MAQAETANEYAQTLIERAGDQGTYDPTLGVREARIGDVDGDRLQALCRPRNVRRIMDPSRPDQLQRTVYHGTQANGRSWWNLYWSGDGWTLRWFAGRLGVAWQGELEPLPF